MTRRMTDDEEDDEGHTCDCVVVLSNICDCVVVLSNIAIAWLSFQTFFVSCSSAVYMQEVFH